MFIGPLLVVGSIIYILCIKNKYKNCTEVTRGVITHLQYVYNSRMYVYPTYEIRVDNKVYRNLSRKKISSAAANIGDSIIVHYNPQCPHQSYFGNSPSYYRPIVFLILGTIMSIPLIVVLLYNISNAILT